jgi:hypothetical protein
MIKSPFLKLTCGTELGCTLRQDVSIKDPKNNTSNLFILFPGKKSSNETMPPWFCLERETGAHGSIRP